MVLVLVGVAVGPSEVPPGSDPDDLVGRMLVDVGLDELPEGVGVPGVRRVEGVGHVVALVHRSPYRAVGRHRQALAVAHPGLDHAQVTAVRVHGHDHRARRRGGPVAGTGVRRAAHIEVHRAVRGDRHVFLPVDVVAGRVKIRQAGGDDRAGPADPAGGPGVTVDLVRLPDVQDPPAGEAGKGQALRRGQAGQQGARRGRPPRPGRQFHDAPAAGHADQQVALRGPGLHTSPGDPRPHACRPPVRPLQPSRRGNAPPPSPGGTTRSTHD